MSGETLKIWVFDNGQAEYVQIRARPWVLNEEADDCSENGGKEEVGKEQSSVESSVQHKDGKLTGSMSTTDSNKFFRPARLVETSDDSSQPWYIVYYVWDPLKRQLIRKRYYKIPGETKEERRRNALSLCAKWNMDLNRIDWTDRKQVIVDGSLEEMLKMALDTKRILKPKTYKNYSDYLKKFIEFMNERFDGLKLSEFTRAHWNDFVAEKKSQKMSNRTLNNYRSHLNTLFEWCVEEGHISVNQMKMTKKLVSGTGRNLAYLPEDQKRIMELAEGYPGMRRLIKVMYYCLLRTNEISNLKIGDIGLIHGDQIYLRKEFSKNGYERHVIMAPALIEELNELKKLNKDWYVFSKNKLLPGKEKIESKRIGEKYREWILSKLKISKEYTLYSWKHTGVINMHRNGISDDDIMKLSGHRDYGSFQRYMKSLGMFGDKDFVLKIPEI